MSGYVRPAKTFLLKFADPEYAGLEVRVKSLPVGQLLKVGRFADTAREAFDLSMVEDLFTAFAGSLISWNLEEPEGVPVPATLDGVLSQETDFMIAVALEWATTLAGVSADLGKDSSSGPISPALSLPMEPLSPSLAS